MSKILLLETLRNTYRINNGRIPVGLVSPLASNIEPINTISDKNHVSRRKVSVPIVTTCVSIDDDVKAFRAADTISSPSEKIVILFHSSGENIEFS
ncbi:hypothetical protein H6784_00960 [Candidatus Nomurabacteria bacterium]|nr:hypothetical protein [Candidatus Nomurabacteria bacterium]